MMKRYIVEWWDTFDGPWRRCESWFGTQQAADAFASRPALVGVGRREVDVEPIELHRGSTYHFQDDWEIWVSLTVGKEWVQSYRPGTGDCVRQHRSWIEANGTPATTPWPESQWAESWQSHRCFRCYDPQRWVHDAIQARAAGLHVQRAAGA